MILYPKASAVGCKARITFHDENGHRCPANVVGGGEYWGGDWHPNMITDLGLDRMAAVTTGDQFITNLSLDTDMPELKRPSEGITADQQGQTVTASAAIFTSADVGRAIVWADGSNARIQSFSSPTVVTVDKDQSVPGQTFEVWAVNRTALGNSVGNSSTSAPDGPDTTWFVDGDEWVIQVGTTLVYELTEPLNIQGFGLRQGGAGPYVVMDNVRDASGTAITVSLLAGKSVRVEHSLQLRISQEPTVRQISIDEYDAANQLVGSTEVDASLWFYADPAYASIFTMYGMFWPGNNLLDNRRVASAPGVITRDPNAQPPTGEYGSLIAPADRAVTAYTPGSRRRAVALTIGATSLNGTFQGLLVRNHAGGASSTAAGTVLQLLGTDFTKESTHTLTFGYELSWDRDYSVS